MNIAYICDGRAPCAGKLGCCFGDPIFGSCTHTTNPIYARNGGCSHPEDYPDRFNVVGKDQNNQPLYFEIDGGGAKSGIYG